MSIQRFNVIGYKADDGIFVNFYDHIASHAFDEAKERELFEPWVISECAKRGLEHDLSRLENGDYENDHCQTGWESWLACAKYRATS